MLEDWPFKIKLFAPLIIAGTMIVLVILSPFIETIFMRPALALLAVAAIISILNILFMLQGPGELKE